MTVQSTFSLAHVQETLLLPLWGRAVESKKEKPLLIDPKAVEIINSIDYDFSTIEKNIGPVSQLAWIGRSLMTDRIANEFLKEHPQATIVDIGCGLDTNFERIDNGILKWYDLDLPEVIELRRNFIQESGRRKFISASFLEPDWLEHLRAVDDILFIAAGVFYYFEEDQIRDFLKRIAGLFPNSECLFDYASPYGVKVANKKVIRGGGFGQGSFLKWGIENISSIESWDSRIKVLGEYSLYEDFRDRIPFRVRLVTYLADYLSIMKMAHLRINQVK